MDVLSPFISILVARVPKITWIRSSFSIQYRCVVGRQKNTEPQHIPLYSSASRRKNMDGDRSSGNGVQTTSEGLVSPNMIIKRSGLTVLADRWKTRTIRKRAVCRCASRQRSVRRIGSRKISRSREFQRYRSLRADSLGLTNCRDTFGWRQGGDRRSFHGRSTGRKLRQKRDDVGRAESVLVDFDADLSRAVRRNTPLEAKRKHNDDWKIIYNSLFTKW